MDRAFHPAVDNLVDTGDGKNAVVCIRKPGQIGWRGVERLRYRSISLSRYPVARGAGSKKLGPPRIFFRLRVQNINRPYKIMAREPLSTLKANSGEGASAKCELPHTAISN